MQLVDELLDPMVAKIAETQALCVKDHLSSNDTSDSFILM
jgi:hypothetical protein